MRRVELSYKYKDQSVSPSFSMEGNIFIKGVGNCRIESNNDAEKSVSVSLISNLVNPRNTRFMAKLLPGQFYQVVRPTATLIIKNTETA